MRPSPIAGSPNLKVLQQRLQDVKERQGNLAAEFKAIGDPRELGQSAIDEWGQMSTEYKQLDAEKAALQEQIAQLQQSEAAHATAKAGAGFELGDKPAMPKLLSAAIDQGRDVQGFPMPAGYALDLRDDKRKETLRLPNGHVATLDWDSQTLGVKNPKGQSFILVGRDEKYFHDLQAQFRSDFGGLRTAEDMKYLPDQPGYDASRGFTGAGSAGQMLSVTEGGSEYTGGAHPNHGSSLLTFDLRTGQKVTLDQLLSKPQLESIVAEVQKKLPTLDGEGTDGGAFKIYGDPTKHVAENFALVTNDKGKVEIDVTWESGVHALGGVVAHFTFAAPEDAAFKEKIGA